MNNILVINAGSSSVKFSVFASYNSSLQAVFSARAVRLFHQDAQLEIYDQSKRNILKKSLAEVSIQSPNHTVAIEFFLGWLSQQSSINLAAVGHRIVHGGSKYSGPVLIDEQVYADLESYQPLAPLHQQHNLAPIHVIQNIYQHLPQIACFDTAFHQTQPDHAVRFGLSDDYFEKGVRRYGFHGLSYEYIVQYLQQEDEIDNKKIVVAHLGNGASMCAIQNAKSIATTMSFTPLDGLLMGTRCGDLDPGIVLYLLDELSLSVEEVSNLLYKQSGLLGISGESNNMKKLLNSNTKNSKRAVEMFCYQVNRHLGMLVAELGGIDLFVFTAGIGENSPIIRKKICKLAYWAGIHIDAEANDNNHLRINTQKSDVEILVIPTNEALMIAKHAETFYSKHS